MSCALQSRKWAITINNPKNLDLEHDVLIDKLALCHPIYFCLADEIATTGTYHTHAYICSKSPIRFRTMQNRFPGAHIEAATGTSVENREYIRKEGKWADTAKAETRVEGTFFEFGDLPKETEETAPKMHQLVAAVEAGKSTAEIIQENPGFALKGTGIDELRERLLSDHFRQENRAVEVSYLFGATGSGKTRSIFEEHKAADICRITDYGKGGDIRFDSYHGQSVLVLEEFHGQVPIATMLNLLDIYPLMLPARYYDRVACYTTVVITSNLALDKLYPEIQHTKPETWKAFLRRIHHIIEFRPDGSTIEHKEGLPYES